MALTPGVLVVAGEPSGDRIAALAARPLALRGVRCWGIGGPACAGAGVELITEASRFAAMGVVDVVRRLPDMGAAIGRLLAQVRRSRPRAALLVNLTELNQRLGRLLRACGVPVLWCVAPQVWAWRASRVRGLRDAVDRLAVVLPFEEALWRRAGVDARYVGHPVLDAVRLPRPEARARLGLPASGRALVVLPGSRAGEIARLAPVLCKAAAVLRASGVVESATLLRAPGLGANEAASLEGRARRHGIPLAEADAAEGASPLLGAFDVALCASGTATLEAALAGAAPVVTYRLDRLSFAVARRLVRTPHIALPNVLLGRRAFPELLQDDVTVGRIASAATELLAPPERSQEAARELEAILVIDSARSFGERVAALLDPWLA